IFNFENENKLNIQKNKQIVSEPLASFRETIVPRNNNEQKINNSFWDHIHKTNIQIFHSFTSEDKTVSPQGHVAVRGVG
ncbi:hypothetical protein QPL65_25545, partial [Escherichia coli]|uniref:hypothetical protein n=1 Tax=Escherichia coli TaxID=562 RepID=UPI0026FF0910